LRQNNSRAHAGEMQIGQLLKRERQNEPELDVWRTARNRYGRAEFSTDFGVHRDPATANPL
jgi:hypothetical protein